MSKHIREVLSAQTSGSPDCSIGKIILQPTDTYSIESDIPNAQQTNTDTETVEKTPLVTLHVRMVEFGIRVASVKSSNPDVADAEIAKNFLPCRATPR